MAEISFGDCMSRLVVILRQTVHHPHPVQVKSRLMKNSDWEKRFTLV